MILTTTDTLESYEIVKYFGLVSDRIVVGEGLFAEFFAGLRDVFGGRSKRIEETLAELQGHALNAIIKKAKRMKANAIVGIKYDIDEISGKNMSMFVINVIGTAVFCRKTLIEDNGSQNVSSANESDVLCFSDKVSETMDAYKTGDILEILSMRAKVPEEEFKELVNDLFTSGSCYNRDVYTIFDIIFKNNYGRMSEQKSKSVISEYLSECDSNLVSELMIKNILSMIEKGGEIHSNSLICEMCESLSNLKISSIEELIRNLDLRRDYDLISLFFAHYKYQYTVEDLRALKRISQMIDKGIFSRIKLVDGPSDAKHWRCKRCGEMNKQRHATCKCGADQRGYMPDELRIAKLKAFIDRLIQAIEE